MPQQSSRNFYERLGEDLERRRSSEMKRPRKSSPGQVRDLVETCLLDTRFEEALARGRPGLIFLIRLLFESRPPAAFEVGSPHADADRLGGAARYQGIDTAGT